MFLFQTCGQLEHCLQHIDRVENVTVVCLCKCRLQAFFYEEKCIFMKNYCFILTKIEMLLVKSQVLYRQMYFLKCYEQIGSIGSIFGEKDRYVLKAK